MTTIIKTAILSIATCLSLCVNAQVTIDETNFPDDILRQYVKGFDYDEDAEIRFDGTKDINCETRKVTKPFSTRIKQQKDLITL